MSKRPEYQWVCRHCDKRNINVIDDIQFDITQQYFVDWECSKCQKETRVHFLFMAERK